MGFVADFRKRISGNKEESQGEVFVIAGLGNPEKKYLNTRHNAGFESIDRLAEKWNISITGKKFSSLVGTGRIGDKKVVLLKPQTYMNRSGEAIRMALDFYKADAATHFIVIYDDVSLEVGQLRVRPKGSAGGHNGMKSIISHLGGSQDFLRVRVGVGEKPEGYDLADYVLGHFDKNDKPLMEEAYKSAAYAVEDLLTMDVSRVMSKYNTKANR